MEEVKDRDVPTPEAPYGYKADGTPRKNPPPGWRQMYPLGKSQAAMNEWEPEVYQYAQLIADGYDPDNSLHFATATEEEIEAAYKLIKKLRL